MPYSKSFINFRCMVCVGKDLSLVFSYRPHSLVTWAVQEPQANTFTHSPYIWLL